MNYSERIQKQILSKTYCGLGSVVVPSNVDRESYIATCFATETISILPELGGMSYNKVPVTLEALQHIEFPEDGNTFGSQVVYLFHPKTRFPIVIAVLDKKSEMYGVNHKQFKFAKFDGDNFVSVVGDGKTGSLFVTVNGDESVSGGQVMLSVGNSSRKGLLTISVQGNIQLLHDDLSVTNLTTNISSRDSVSVSSKKVIVKASDKISLGKENGEPAVLGQALIDDVLNPLMNALTNLKVETKTGLPYVDFTASIGLLSAKLNNILSKKVELE